MQFALKPMWGINYVTHERFKLPQLDEPRRYERWGYVDSAVL